MCVWFAHVEKTRQLENAQAEIQRLTIANVRMAEKWNGAKALAKVYKTRVGKANVPKYPLKSTHEFHRNHHVSSCLLLFYYFFL